MAAGEFPQSMPGSRRGGAHGFICQETLNIERKGIGCFVAARAILVDGLHDDPIQISLHQMTQLVGLHVPGRRNRRPLVSRDRAEAQRGLGRLNLADDPTHFLVTSRDQRLGIEGRTSGQQFIQENAQCINVTASIDVQSTQRRLFRAHVNRGSDELFKPGENCFVGETDLGGFGDAEINHLGHGLDTVERDQNIGGLDIAVDDPLLVRVMDGGTDLGEKQQTFPGSQFVLVTELRHGNALHQFHHEKRTSGLRASRIINLGDVGMIHHRERLPLLFEPSHHLLRVHPGLDDFQRHPSPDGLLLLRHPDGPKSPLANLLE